MSDGEWHRPGVRYGLRAVHIAMLLFLLVVGLGPLLWLAKSAITPTQDTLRMPMALWPNGIDIDNLAAAWHKVHIDRYLLQHPGHRAGAHGWSRSWSRRPRATPCPCCVPGSARS